MAENENVVVEEEKITAEDYLANLQALKNNTVSKDEYNRLIAENKKLADALANGLPYENDVDKEEEVDIDALRQNFFDKHKNSLQMAKDMLALRDAVIESGQPDPALGNNPETFTPDNMAEVERVMTAIREAVEAADGNNDVFYSELQRRFPY